MPQDQRNHSSSTTARPHLSVVVNTLNEETHIEDCLKSVQEIADEIVLVDMYSDDRTVEIARRYTDRVFFHERTGLVEPARQAAIEQARGDWILLLDADERISRELAAGIRDVVSNPGGVDVFCIPRRNFIAGRWMRGTGFGPDAEPQPRLFRRGSLHWPDRIHAYPIIQGAEAPLPLPDDARIDHYAYADLRDFVEQLNRYTDHEARILEDDGITWSLDRMLSAARDELSGRYDPERDGIHSLVLAISVGFHRFLTWAKLWERQGYPQARLPRGLSDLFYPLPHSGTDELPPDSPPCSMSGEPAIEASIVLDKGFHEDEGGWRWMSSEGRIRISADALPGELRFALTCSKSDYYEHFPFQVQILVGRRHHERVFFETSDERKDIRIPLDRSGADVQIRIKSQEVFVPVYLGLNRDDRRLSIRLSDLALDHSGKLPSEGRTGPEPAVAGGAAPGSPVFARKSSARATGGRRSEGIESAWA